MIKEAIERIEKLVNDSRKTTVVNLPHEAENVYGLDTKEGFEIRTGAPRPVRIEACNVESFVTAAKDHLNINVKPVIFVGEEGAIIFLDTRRDAWVRLRLTTTHTYQVIQGLNHSCRMQHRDFIRFLKSDLYAAIGREVIELLSAMKIMTGGEIESRTKAGEESLSKAVRHKVGMSDESVPESIILTPLVLKRIPVEASITCGLDVDGDGMFSLFPLDGELMRAFDAAVHAVKTMFAAAAPDGWTIIEGTPNED